MKYAVGAVILLAATGLLIVLTRSPTLRVEIESRHDHGGVVFTELQARRGAEISRLYCLMLPPDSYRAEIIDQPDRSDRRPRLRDIATSHHALAAINGGFFEPDFSSTGFYVIENRVVSPMSTAPLLSAVVWCDGEGRMHVDRSLDFHGMPRHAVQVGPLLIEPGGNIGIDETSTQKAKRSVIAMDERGAVLLIYAEDISLHQIAVVLHDYAEVTGLGEVHVAANLDGGPSSGLFVDGSAGPVLKQETGPIRNAIVFRSK